MSRYKAGVVLLTGVLGCGVSYALTGVLLSLPFAIAFLFVCGVASTVYFVPLISVSQREAPDYVRGRVMSSRFLLSQAGLLVGMAIAGPLTDRVGAPVVFVAAGVLVVFAALVGFAYRDLRDATLRDVSTAPLLRAASG
jgi:MFS family permease